jgi:hypothetical protein
MTGEDDEMSAGSRGSHGPVSVSVHVDKSACGLPYSRPLRRTVPTLTADERRAIDWAATMLEHGSLPESVNRTCAETLRGILNRMK